MRAEEVPMGARARAALAPLQPGRVVLSDSGQASAGAAAARRVGGRALGHKAGRKNRSLG